MARRAWRAAGCSRRLEARTPRLFVQGAAGFEIQRLAIQIGHQPAGLFDDQTSRRPGPRFFRDSPAARGKAGAASGRLAGGQHGVFGLAVHAHRPGLHPQGLDEVFDLARRWYARPRKSAGCGPSTDRCAGKRAAAHNPGGRLRPGWHLPRSSRRPGRRRHDQRAGPSLSGR